MIIGSGNAYHAHGWTPTNVFGDVYGFAIINGITDKISVVKYNVTGTSSDWVDGTVPMSITLLQDNILTIDKKYPFCIMDMSDIHM